jgi:hypothetical protein
MISAPDDQDAAIKADLHVLQAGHQREHEASTGRVHIEGGTAGSQSILQEAAVVGQLESGVMVETIIRSIVLGPQPRLVQAASGRLIRQITRRFLRKGKATLADPRPLQNPVGVVSPSPQILIRHDLLRRGRTRRQNLSSRQNGQPFERTGCRERMGSSGQVPLPSLLSRRSGRPPSLPTLPPTAPPPTTRLARSSLFRLGYG